MAILADRTLGYIIGGLGLGGAERELLHQTKALSCAGQEVVVFSLGDGEGLEIEVSRYSRVIRIAPGRQKLRKCARLVALLEGISKHNVGLIHSQTFYTNLYAFLAGRIRHIPAIGAVQSDVYSELEGKGLLGQFSLKWPPWMTVNSKAAFFTALDLGRSEDKTFLLENALDIESFDRRAGLPNTAPLPHGILVLSVGNLRRPKRHDLLMRALAVARESVPQLTCAIVGDGPLKNDLRDLAGELRLGQKVLRFLGWRQDVPALLKRADLFALASDHEGYPNALQEAMAAGLPVVATRVGAVPDMIDDGYSGILVRPGDFKGMAAAIVRLVRNSVLRGRMGDRARVFAEREFSLDRLRDDLVRIYSKVWEAQRLQ